MTSYLKFFNPAKASAQVHGSDDCRKYWNVSPTVLMSTLATVETRACLFHPQLNFNEFNKSSKRIVTIWGAALQASCSIWRSSDTPLQGQWGNWWQRISGSNLNLKRMMQQPAGHHNARPIHFSTNTKPSPASCKRVALQCSRNYSSSCDSVFARKVTDVFSELSVRWRKKERRGLRLAKRGCRARVIARGSEKNHRLAPVRSGSMRSIRTSWNSKMKTELQQFARASVLGLPLKTNTKLTTSKGSVFFKPFRLLYHQQAPMPVKSSVKGCESSVLWYHPSIEVLEDKSATASRSVEQQCQPSSFRRDARCTLRIWTLEDGHVVSWWPSNIY